MTASMEEWRTAMQPPAVVAFFRGLFDRAGVHITDTGEAFTVSHTGDRIEFAPGISQADVDFTVDITARQAELLLENAHDGVLDERERFRIMAVLATPATRSFLARPIIQNRLLRSLLFKIGRAESLMHVVFVAPAGEQEVTHTLAYADGQWLVVPGLHGAVDHVWRMTVEDTVAYQRRMLAARKANRPMTWLSFARWYSQLRRRVVVSKPRRE